MTRSEWLAFIIVIIVVCIVVYLAVFRDLSKVQNYTMPSGTSNNCNFQSDCNIGLVCTSYTDPQGTLHPGTCQPWCVTAGQAGPNGKDSCSTFISQSSQCGVTPGGDPYSFFCQTKVCSSTIPCSSATNPTGEICVPTTAGAGTTGLCYPDPTQDTPGQPSHIMCDPSNVNTGGNCYGNPNIPCKLGTYPGSSTQQPVCTPSNIIAS